MGTLEERAGDPSPGSWLMRTLTLQAKAALPPDSPPPPLLDDIAPFLFSALVTLSHRVYIDYRPPREAVFYRPGVPPPSSTALLKELSVDDFGRFAGKYYGFRSTVYHVSADGELVGTPRVVPAEPVPDELKPPMPKSTVTRRKTRLAAGAPRSPLRALPSACNTQSPSSSPSRAVLKKGQH